MEPIARAHRHTSVPVAFVADTHLADADTAAVDRFEALCRRCGDGGIDLYVLGDLFDVWIGDDDPSRLARRVTQALAALSARSTVWFMAGNRDFLVGADWLARSGARALPEPAVIELFGHRTVVCHGDTLCTDDIAYQQLRRQVRDPRWQARFLARPVAERRAIAESLRGDSGQAMADKPAAAMDVTAAAVVDLARRSGADTIVHGHTHRPDRHRHRVDGRTVERHVLPDWCKPRAHELLLATRDGLEPISIDALSASKAG